MKIRQNIMNIHDFQGGPFSKLHKEVIIFFVDMHLDVIFLVIFLVYVLGVSYSLGTGQNLWEYGAGPFEIWTPKF